MFAINPTKAQPAAQGHASGLLGSVSSALIATANGELPVDQLCVGDKVLTRDNGFQDIRWTGRAMIGQTDDAMCPILIRQGALGHGMPQRDIVVSPDHRVVVTSEIARLLFDEREVLIGARHLLGLSGVERMALAEVSYVQIMFDHHEVVLSDGAWTECYQIGDDDLSACDPAQRNEILTVFPTLAEQDAKISKRNKIGFVFG